MPDTARHLDRSHHSHRRSHRKRRRYRRRVLRVVLFATAWALTVEGAYEVVSTYALAVRDPDGNLVGSGLSTAALKFAVCVAAGGACLFLAHRLRR